MSFNSFCNICFIKENIIKLCREENEPLLNILISFTSYSDTINGIIYLCINCCNKLEEYNKFRELFLTNFVRFRYLYSEHKKQLEIRKAPDIETQLKAFVDVNVERASGTPLIENYEAAQALKKDDIMHTDASFKSGNNISENETQTCHVKCENDTFNEDQVNINGSSIYIKGEPSSFVEVCHEITNTDIAATSVPCSSSVNNEKCNLPTAPNIFKKEDTSLEEDKPNPDRFDESHDQIDVIDCDLLRNPENCVTDDNTNEEGTTDEAKKEMKIDTVCSVCLKKFPCIGALNRHIRTHTGERPYRCDECHKTFTQRFHLTEHKRIHSGEKPHKCDECGLGFTRRSNLKTHKRTHTGEKSYPCDECNKTFTATSNLIKHKRIHSGEKPYQCNECGSGFTHRSNLNKHKRTHTGERPYSCDECQKTYTEISTLIKHKRIHSGEKPYKCDECGIQFREGSSLNRHKRTHTGERPYSCDKCHKTFTDNSNLKKHKRIHSEEKPYKCDECGLGFTRRSILNIHKCKHTGEKPYSCDECREKFTYRSYLIKHKRIHSGGKP